MLLDEAHEGFVHILVKFHYEAVVDYRNGAWRLSAHPSGQIDGPAVTKFRHKPWDLLH